MPLLMFYQSDNVFEVQNLKNVVTDTFITTATVTVTMYSTPIGGAANELTGPSWPLAMPYVVGSDATYRATVPDTMGWPRDQLIYGEVIADGGSGLRMRWMEPITVTQ